MQLFDDDHTAFDADYDPTRPTLLAPRARVLVVDDDPLSRELVGIKLLRDGYEVFEARSGEEALAILDSMHRENAPTDDVDLLVLDIHMPGKSGMNVLCDLRRRHSTIPVLFITGSPDPGLFTMAACLDARVMLKPVALEHLADVAIKLILSRAKTSTSSAVG